MIKTTVNGQAVTSSAWQTDVREVNSKAYYYANNTWTEIPNEIKNWTVTKGVCGDDKFELGTAFIPTGSITFSTSEEENALASSIQIIRIDAGVKVEEDFEYISIGTFWITEKTSDAYETTFTLTSYLLGGRSGRAFSAKKATGIQTILDTVASDMGNITIRSDVALPSYGLAKAVSGGTCRAALEVVASCFGMCLTEDGEGVVFKKIFPSAYDSILIDESMLSVPFVSKGTFELKSGKIVVSEGYSGADDENGSSDASEDIPEVSYTFLRNSSASGSSYTTGVTLESYDLITSNEYVSTSIFTGFCEILKTEDARWEAGQIELQLGDPRIEALDVIQLMNGEAQTHSIYAWHITHSFDGGYTTTVTAAVQDRSDDAVGYDVSGNGIAVIVPIINAKVDGIVKEVHQVQYDLEQATQDVESLWSDEDRAKYRTDSIGEALNYKVDTNLVKNDVVLGSCYWDEQYNTLRIGGANESGNRYYETRIGGDGIQFMYGSNKDTLLPVASIDQDKLIINKTVVFTESIICNWAWTADLTTGHLSLKYVGD